MALAEGRSARRVLTIVNCAEVTRPGWRFLEGELQVADADLRWLFLSCWEPANWLERRVKRPRLSRYRACFQAALQAKRNPASVVITHMPRATCWTAVFCRLLRVDAPHLAFSFNFTDLPTGRMLKLMRVAFSSVTKFVVYSNAEKDLYSQVFVLDHQRFDVVPWAMDVPSVSSPVSVVEEPYVCAIGGEGRDFRTLLTAMASVPDVPMTMVCRPGALDGLAVPPNVRAEYDAPIDRCWNLIAFSRFSVVPLRNASTNCGHITIVASLLLGRALVTTRSEGTVEYVDSTNAEIVEPGSPAELAAAIERLWADPQRAAALGAEGRARALERHSPAIWRQYVQDFLESISVW